MSQSTCLQNERNYKLEKQVLTPRELMGYLGLGRNSVYELLRSEGFPVVKVGRLNLIPIKQLNEWLEKRCKENADE